jgi:hypothetical protein
MARYLQQLVDHNVHKPGPPVETPVAEQAGCGRLRAAAQIGKPDRAVESQQDCGRPAARNLLLSASGRAGWPNGWTWTTRPCGNIVLDWRKQQNTRAAVRVAVEETLDRLPDKFTRQIYVQKCDIVYQHVFDCYWDNGHSVYDTAA